MFKVMPYLQVNIVEFSPCRLSQPCMYYLYFFTDEQIVIDILFY